MFKEELENMSQHRGGLGRIGVSGFGHEIEARTGCRIMCGFENMMERSCLYV